MARKKAVPLFEDDSVSTQPGIEIDPKAKPPKLERIPDKGERRGAPRYALEFETVIFCKGISCRTRTINLSLTGALLADAIPHEFVNQILDIVMIRHVGKSKDYYLVKGKALGAPFRSPRIHFTDIPDVQKEKLKALLQDAARYAASADDGDKK